MTNKFRQAPHPARYIDRTQLFQPAWLMRWYIVTLVLSIEVQKEKIAKLQAKQPGKATPGVKDKTVLSRVPVGIVNSGTAGAAQARAAPPLSCHSAPASAPIPPPLPPFT